jgi:hypothetical protein
MRPKVRPKREVRTMEGILTFVETVDLSTLDDDVLENYAGMLDKAAWQTVGYQSALWARIEDAIALIEDEEERRLN